MFGRVAVEIFFNIITLRSYVDMLLVDSQGHRPAGDNYILSSQL